MKIVIHGTKGGYSIFSPEKGATIDSRPDYSKVAAIGQQAYSIYFTNEDVVFSKYRIIRDAVRDKATGNIGFSLFLPLNKKLPGSLIKELLDKLSETYYSKYIPNNDNNLGDVREDWAFLDEIKTDLRVVENLVSRKPDERIRFESGSADAAFVYFDEGMPLKKFFDDPFQNEYLEYRQVFFVDKKFDGLDENPLNALRRNSKADLTTVVTENIVNPKYTLSWNNILANGLRIDVFVNGIKINNGYNLRSNDRLKISWSKEYCNPRQTEEKTWKEIGDEFLRINHDSKTISIKEIELQEKKHIFKIETVDINNQRIEGAEITLNDYIPIKIDSDGNITITDKVLQKGCTLMAKTDKLRSKPKQLSISNTSGKIDIQLLRYKKVTFDIRNENGDEINWFSLKIEKRNSDIKEKTVEFWGNEVDEKNLLVTIRTEKYELHQFRFCPADVENPKIILQKKISSSNTSHFKYDKNSKTWDADNEPRRKWYNKYLKYALLGLVAVVLVIVGLNIFSGSEPSTTIPRLNSKDSSRVAYLEGIELNLITLQIYQTEYCDNNTPLPQNNNTPSEPTLWDRLWPFGIDEAEKTIIAPTNYNEICTQINNAIAIRKSINMGKINELRGKEYSTEQQKFKTAIDSIKPEYESKIEKILYDTKVSSMNLDEVADFINQKLDSLKRVDGEKMKDDMAENLDKTNKTEQGKSNTSNAVTGSQNRGSTGDKTKDKEPFQVNFWNIMGKDNITKKEIKNWRDNSNILNNDAYAQFYDNYLLNNDSHFNKLNSNEERKKATTLTQLKTICSQ